ncbi:hypothetical protein DDE05_21860 [Streptomyces cavourensis]|nr:hypothetical protein DDE05_21860 [Streptomyces cavourensis]
MLRGRANRAEPRAMTQSQPMTGIMGSTVSVNEAGRLIGVSSTVLDRPSRASNDWMRWVASFSVSMFSRKKLCRWPSTETSSSSCMRFRKYVRATDIKTSAIGVPSLYTRRVGPADRSPILPFF